MKTRHFIALKIISLILLLSLGYFGVQKICRLINNVNTKQEKLARQIHELHVADGSSSSIPYKKYAGKFTATFYCSCPICVGKKSVVRTVTGYKPRSKRTLAVDTNIIPLHSIVYIKGLGFFVAEDTGGHIKGHRVDIYVDNHEQAKKLGRKSVEIYILQ